MAMFKVTRASTALSTTNDLMTITCAASRRIKIVAISVGAMGTASAANSIMVQRSTGGVTAGGAITPERTVTDSVAASAVISTTWGTQPTLSLTPLTRIPVNANGGVFRFVYTIGHEIELRNSEQLSLRSETGTSNVVITVEWEEF